MADGGRCYRAARSGGDVGGARLAGVGRAGADGPGIRVARRRRVLHVRAAIAPRAGKHGDSEVTGIESGFVIFGVMLTLMVVRVPIGIAMFIVGFGGYLYLTG